VQLDPIKPTLKPSRAKRLRLKYDESLSIFALKRKLRRYNEVAKLLATMPMQLARYFCTGVQDEAGFRVQG